MEDFPTYTTVKYYYNTCKTSTTYQSKYGNVIASIVYTEDGCVYLNLQQGRIITPDSLSEERRIIMHEWITKEEIEYAIKYQPYDFDAWTNGAHASYSKSFWQLTLEDIRDIKIEAITIRLLI